MLREEDMWAVLIVEGIGGSLLLSIWCSYLLNIRVLKSLLFCMVVIAITGCWIALEYLNTSANPQMHMLTDGTLYPRLRGEFASMIVGCIYVTMTLSAVLLAKVYRAAVLSIGSTAEHLPGMPGVAAWLSPLNVITVIVVSIVADLGLHYSFFVLALMGFALLIAYPLFQTQMRQISHEVPLQAPADERQRVLALVEGGKITAEDAAELLSALAQSHVAAVDAGTPVSGPRRLILIGAAAMLVSFFLPWFTINITQAMQQMVGTVQQNMPQFNGMPMPNTTIPGMTFNASPNTVVPVQNMLQSTVHGGDVQHGLGWFALAMAGLVGALPYFWNPSQFILTQQRNTTFAALACGSITMLYLLSDHLNSVTTLEPGFIVGMMGYIAMWAGAVREYRARRTVMPVAADAFA